MPREMNTTAGDYNPVFDTKGKLALIDADKYKYILTYHKFKNYEETGELDDIRNHLRVEVGYLEDIFDKMIFVFSGHNKNTFRSKMCVDKEYKGNRKGRPDPYFYEGKFEDMNDIPDLIRSLGHFVLYYDDIEADDIISMLQNDKTIVVSDDKDLLQIPGFHFDKKNEEVIHITNDEAIIKLALQMITGDSTDNISGIPGVGPKTAEKLLENIPADHVLDIVLKQYKERYGIIEGFDRFAESWWLLKLRIDRSLSNKKESFMKEKYKDAFALRDGLLITEFKSTIPMDDVFDFNKKEDKKEYTQQEIDSWNRQSGSFTDEELNSYKHNK